MNHEINEDHIVHIWDHFARTHRVLVGNEYFLVHLDRWYRAADVGQLGSDWSERGSRSGE